MAFKPNLTMKNTLARLFVFVGVLFLPFSWQIYKWHLIMIHKLGASLDALLM
jgi:hypothetical protein